MAYDIGPKIGIDGEAEFRSQINQVNTVIRTLGTEMQAVSSQFAKNEKTQESLTAQNQVLNKQIEEQRKKLELLQRGLQESSQKYGDADEKTLKWQQTVNKATAELNKLINQVKENDTAIDQLGNEVTDTAAAFDDAGKKASTFGDILAANLSADAIKGSISGIKDAVIDLGKELSAYSMESENATKKAAAYFGETGEAAQQTADVISAVYTGGVGDSLDQVSDAVITVKKNLENLSETDLKNLTDQALTLDSLYGIDMNETLRGVNALMEQFGLDAQTAMDYIVAGTQNGLDKTNELGDNLSEYAGKFEQAGYTAQEYFQLLNNGLDGGAYNLDKVNDAINEVTTRLADGTISEVIGTYSKETQNLFSAWQTGGATQKQVIDSIVNDISKAGSQQEALNLAAQAFGTMAEDGNLKFITSLTSVGETYDNVIGKSQEMFDATTTSQQQLDSALRTAKESLQPIGDSLNEMAIDIIPKAAEGFVNFATFLQTYGPVMLPIIAAIGAGFAVWNISSMLSGVTGSLGGLQGAMTALNGVIAANPIGLFVTALAALTAGLVVAYNTSDTFRNTVNAAFEAVRTFVVTAIETVKNAVVAAWKFISTDTNGQLGIMQAYVNTVFNGIRTFINVTMTAIQGIIKAITQIMSGDWSGAWETIKETVSSIGTQIKEFVTNAFSDMYNAVKNKVTDIANSVKTGLEDAVDYVKSLPEKFLTWGTDMIDNLVSGIKKGIKKVRDAISGVADTIREYIHFTEPDVGPLSDFHTYMPDMTKMLTAGIRKGIPDVKSAMNDLSSIMVPRYADGTAAYYNRMISVLSNMTVVLEDGTLVGKLLPRINKGLGNIKKTESRFGL